jgi:hypothetical protein
MRPIDSTALLTIVPPSVATRSESSASFDASWADWALFLTEAASCSVAAAVSRQVGRLVIGPAGQILRAVPDLAGRIGDLMGGSLERRDDLGEVEFVGGYRVLQAT